MKIPQISLLSPNPIIIQGVGTLRSPILNEIYSSDIRNLSLYSLATHVLFGSKQDIIELGKNMGDNNTYHKLIEPDIEITSKFNLIINSVDLREALCEALTLFFCNKIVFSPENKCFLVLSVIDDKASIVGSINDDNYLFIEDLLKQLLHCESEYSDNELKYSSDKAKELWEKVSQAEEKEKADVNARDYEIGNIVSKLCVCGIGYTVKNIYDLTVYQLYDQFSAYMQNRISQLSENAYAHNGGEDFDVNGWLRK
jgi:hypothetical protein